ncbi:MAG: DoxX family protein [Nanoarchaeota archaeon]
MRNKILWGAKIIVALIFLQSLFFKFTGADEAVYIFSQIGIEPWGRYLVGVGELFASVLILIPSLSFYGAILASLIIIPAIIFHLTTLGIVVYDDNGLLFGLAIVVLILSVFILVKRKKSR